MEVVVTRPAAAAARTAAALRSRGFVPVVAPLLAIVAAPPPRLLEDAIAGVIATSAASFDAIAGHPDLSALARLPLWAVGGRTAAVATALGFGDVREGGGDAAALAARLRQAGDRGQLLLWLTGGDVAVDLGPLLAPAGIGVVRRVVYRADVVATFPAVLATALRQGTPGAVLHFSPRTAAAYVRLADDAGLGEAALRPRQLCLSAAVATPLAIAGARQIAVAAAPDAPSLLALLEHAAPILGT